MPIYEFTCDECDLRFEEILPATHTDTPPCPLCETNAKVRKLLSACVHQTAAAGSRTQGCRPQSGFS
jgi:putative FmdB family regulatory protein